MNKENWISRTDAMQVIRNSDWAQVKKPRDPGAAFATSFAIGRLFEQTERETDKQLRKFEAYLGLNLKSFADHNKNAVREADDGKMEYELSQLDEFLLKALERDLVSEFGAVPR